MTSLDWVRPLRQTWTTARGVMVYAPEPTSLLLMTKPAAITGSSSPLRPSHGAR
ncbi:hypothetical protein QBB34_47885 [Streptomyces stelliscabiei]|uniref:hypothetical protein n=1 Tax=Streptomyces stelliscabiei TaxID=146820 RepID=UPI002FF080B6